MLSEAGFLDEVTYDSIAVGPGYDRPYQFDPNVRESKTVQLYKHLNLKSCIWTFDAYYDMTELIDVCGGAVTADFQVLFYLLCAEHHFYIISLLFNTWCVHLSKMFYAEL